MTFATLVFQKVIIGMFLGQRQQGILSKKKKNRTHTDSLTSSKHCICLYCVSFYCPQASNMFAPLFWSFRGRFWCKCCKKVAWMKVNSSWTACLGRWVKSQDWRATDGLLPTVSTTSFLFWAIRSLAAFGIVVLLINKARLTFGNQMDRLPRWWGSRLFLVSHILRLSSSRGAEPRRLLWFGQTLHSFNLWSVYMHYVHVSPHYFRIIRPNLGIRIP